MLYKIWGMLESQKHNLHDLFSIYIDQCTFTRGLRDATIKSYKEVFTFFMDTMPEITFASDLKVYVINEFFKRISTRTRIVGRDTKKRGLKASTILSYFNRLTTFFSWLEQQGYIEQGSLVCKLRKPLQPVYDDERALSKNEVNAIVSAITLHNIDNSFQRIRDLLIVSILLYSGIRKGELLGLKIDDVDFESKLLHIKGSSSKSKRSRMIPLHSKVLLQLRKYLSYRRSHNFFSPFLFVSSHDKPLTEHGLKHWVKRYAKASNTPFHLHRFRHTFACTMAQNGADIISIKNVLGHSSIKMTQHYLRSIKSENSRVHIENLSF